MLPTAGHAPGIIARCLEVLTEEERRERRQKTGSPHEEERVLSRALLRATAARYCETPDSARSLSALASEVALRAAPGGKPFLDGPFARERISESSWTHIHQRPSCID